MWLSLLDERLYRYPADDGQVTATRLGNAIRRFEEYGYDRFRLDSQVLWHELNAVVADSARKQGDDARASVDFFVCLLYGHLLVAASACAELGIGAPATPWLVAAAIVGLPILAAAWYRVAVVATDDWAGPCGPWSTSAGSRSRPRWDSRCRRRSTTNGPCGRWPPTSPGFRTTPRPPPPWTAFAVRMTPLTVDIRGMTIEARPANRDAADSGARRAPGDR